MNGQDAPCEPGLEMGESEAPSEDQRDVYVRGIPNALTEECRNNDGQSEITEQFQINPKNPPSKMLV